VTAAADSERMKYEASVLKQNPMLIQKIIAERLSDKLQIMMVPMDGKNFFAADVMRSAFQNNLSNNGGSATARTNLHRLPRQRRSASPKNGRNHEFGEAARARAASHERRPTPRAARFASRKEKSHARKIKHRRA